VVGKVVSVVKLSEKRIVEVVLVSELKKVVVPK
jgi:hypothetical protein